MYVPCILYGLLCRPTNAKHIYVVQGGSNMTGTDFCVNNPHMSRSYLNHLVYQKEYTYDARTPEL